MNSKNELFSSLDLNSKKNIAIIGSSFCSCLLGDYLKIKYGAEVVFYEKTKFIGGAWRSDNFGNVFSNIIAPTNNSERKVFKKVLIFLKKKKIKIKKLKYNSFYANQIVDSYIFDFNHFYKKIKESSIIKKLKVNFIQEKNNHVLINNKFKHDYVLFPNSVNLKNITKKSKLCKTFKIPKGKIIKSKHIRIICKDIPKDNFKDLYYREQTLGPIDRLQATGIKQNIFMISARISRQSKHKSKSSLTNNVSKLLGIKRILESSINIYSSIHYSPKQIKEINSINAKFSRIKHYNTSSVMEFINKYLL